MNKISPNINVYTAWKKRRDWFIERIGQKIYRPPVKCTCESCVNGHKEGVLILDVDHALYLHSAESEIGIRYSDKQLPH